MAAPKRNARQREADFTILSAMYLRGKPQWEIAETIGVSRQQISYDLKELQRRWRESPLRNFDEQRGQELAKIDQLELTYWAAWERSLGVREIKTAKKSKGKDEAGIRKEEMLGNPAYLAGVERCIERRCKLLGLDAPTKNVEMGYDEWLKATAGAIDESNGDGQGDTPEAA